jgi:hypothetical protein
VIVDDVVKMNEKVHLMKDVVLAMVLLDNDDDAELLHFDQMKLDMCNEFLDQFEFVLQLMNREIQNEVFHLRRN